MAGKARKMPGQAESPFHSKKYIKTYYEYQSINVYLPKVGYGKSGLQLLDGHTQLFGVDDGSGLGSVDWSIREICLKIGKRREEKIINN
jgi:hypothetical protein